MRELDTKARLNGLDGIRGILALVVALSHAFGHYTGWGSGIYPIKNGSFAVDVFFVMSGIVLFHVYHDAISNNKLGAYEFFMRRLFRLYPMHFLCMILIPVALYIASGVSYPSWLGNFTRLNLIGDSLLLNTLSIGFDFVSNQPSWSISIELYIGSILVFLSCKKHFIPILTIFLSAILFYVFSISPKDINVTHAPLVNGGIVRCLFSMSAGMIAYKLIKNYQSNLMESRNFSNATCIIGFSVMCLVIYKIKLNIYSYFFIVLFLSCSISIIGVIGCKALSFLDRGLFYSLGKRSFSIYLLHTPLLYTFLHFKSDNNLYNSIIAVLIIFLTVLLSGFTYTYIEKPFIKSSHKMFKSPH